MKTYYIVKSFDNKLEPRWTAHISGVLSTFNIFSFNNWILETISGSSADECEEHLRIFLKAKNIKPQIVRVVTI